MVFSGVHVARLLSPCANGKRLKCSHVSGCWRWQGHMVYSGDMSIFRRAYQLATLSRRGSCSSKSWARRVCRCTGIRDGSRAEKYNAVRSVCMRRPRGALSA